jgi:hypothetical protein
MMVEMGVPTTDGGTATFEGLVRPRERAAA